MKIKEDIQQLIQFDFTQKEAVQELLQRGYTKEEIAKVIYAYYPQQPTDDSGAFIISVIGQLLLIAFCIPAITVGGYYIFILVILIQFILLLGFCTKNKVFVYACTGLFVLAALIFAVLSFSASGLQFYFVFGIAASFCSRMTYRVAKIAEYKEEQYQFE